MKRNYLLEILGFRFIVNRKTKEVHRVATLHPSCQIPLLRNGKYFTLSGIKKLLRGSEYNGCIHCFKEKDTDYEKDC